MNGFMNKKKQKINDLISEGDTFLSSGTQLLEKRAELIAKVYKASSTFVPLLELGLKLLDVEKSNEPKLDLYWNQCQKKLDCSHLRERWSTQLRIYDKSKSLEERLAVLGEECAPYVQSSEKVELLREVIDSFAGEILRKEYSKLEKTVSSLESNPVCYDLDDNKVTLTIPKSEDKMDRAIAAIVNCFICAYDLSQETPLEQTRLLVDFGKIVNRNEKFSFHLKYSPHFKENRKLLKDRGVIVSEYSATEIFGKAVEVAKPQIDSLMGERINSNSKGNSNSAKSLTGYMDAYLEASRYIFMASPNEVNLSELEKVLLDWKPSNKQWVTIPQHYAYAVFEAAKHEPDDVKKDNLLNWCIESAFLSLRERGEDSRASYAPMYALFARIEKYAEEVGINVNVGNHLKGLSNDVQDKIECAVGKEVFGALKGGDFLQAVIASLGDLSDLEKRCISKKGKTVFIPIDELGVPAYDLIVKVGGGKVNEEYSWNKLVYDTLKEANGSKEVPFPRPLELRKVSSANGDKYLYFMERSPGLSLSQKFRHWRYQYTRLGRWGYQNEQKLLAEKEEKEIKLALTNLARFHGQLYQKFKEKTLSTEVRVKSETETCETFSHELKQFDYLENLVERAFVKSKDPKSKERVTELLGIIQQGDKAAFDELDKRDYFKSRIPYSEGVYDFLVEYNKFIQQNLSNLPISVVLHGDAHLNNVLEGGTLIDNKPLKVGHPFVDIAHFLEHPSLHQFMDVPEIEKLVDFYVEELKQFGVTVDLTLDDTYRFHRVHNSICLLGAMLEQGEYKEAEFYVENALKAAFPIKSGNLVGKLRNAILHTNNGGLKKAENEFSQWEHDQHQTFRTNQLNFEKLLDDFYEQMKIENDAKRKVVIGIDFDGVIANSDEMKVDYARDKYGLRMTENDCNLEKAIKAGMTKEQYQQMVADLYGTERCMEMKPIPRAIKAILDLNKAGFKSYIVTSRSGDEVKWARRWLDDKKLGSVEVINTSDQPKLDACKEKGISLFIDDSYSKLVPLAKAGIAGYLFTTPPNKDCDVTDASIRRMDRWDEISTIVNYHKEQVKAGQSAAPRLSQTRC